jgi:hypothetical protein
MTMTSWTRGPVGIDAGTRLTATGCCNVLVMVPTVTAGNRLMDLVPLFDGDFRVQLTVTVPNEGEIWHGLDEFVRSTGMVVLPWEQAHRHHWDLVLSASHRHIERVSGALLVLPHGAGSEMSRRFSRKAGAASRPTTGLDRDLLTYRGRLIPAAVALPHERELTTLRRTCPEALLSAVVTGDLCLDRMRASSLLRDQYRAALGVSAGQRLVTISSTWSPHSLFGRHRDLYEQVVDALTPHDRVAMVLHPNVWAVHGAWQVRSWLAAAVRKGLLVVPAAAGWQATVVASDVVIGDFGSTTSYAAALGIKVLLADHAAAAVRKGSIADVVAAGSGQLDLRQDLAAQVRRCRPTANAGRVAAALSSAPDLAASRFRAAMYRLLELAEPDRVAAPQPFALPVVS